MKPYQIIKNAEHYTPQHKTLEEEVAEVNTKLDTLNTNLASFLAALRDLFQGLSDKEDKR